MPKDSSKSSEGGKVMLKTGRSRLLSAAPTIKKVLSSKTVNSSTATAADTLSAPAIIDIEQRLACLEKETMGVSWFEVLKPEFGKSYFLKLKTFLLEEHRSHVVYPPLKDVYSWSKLTPLNQVKVIILGQDPYHNVGQAHGLSFSVLPPTKPPGSLKNIYKQLTLDYPDFIPPATGHVSSPPPDLSALAKQGVLWLNTSLTVRAHKAGTHANKGWETFTAQVIRAVMDENKKKKTGKGLVFMAWGLPAQKTCAKLGIDENEHLILKSAHPSPLSAHRGFIGNGHFRLANKWLKERSGEESQIDWMVLSRSRERILNE